jgi:WD40 repeat protein
LDLASERVIHSYSGPVGFAIALAFSPDEKTFLSGGEDGTVRLWDVEKGQIWGVKYEADRQDPHFRQDWNEVLYVAFMPDGKEVLAAMYDGTVKLLDSRTGKDVRVFNTARRLDTANLSHDGTTLATATLSPYGSTIYLWDVATGREMRKFKDGDDGGSVALLPDGKTVFSGSGFSLKLWDASTGKLLKNIRSQTLMSDTVLSPDGKIVLAGAAKMGDGAVTKWDMTTGKIVGRLVGHTTEILEISFSADSTTALSDGIDDTLILWDVSKGAILHKLKV